MRRFVIRRATPGAGEETLAEGVLFGDTGGPVVARQLLPMPGPPIVWASLPTLESVWCYGDLGLVEWIDQEADADAGAGRRLVVSVLEVQERLVLNVHKPARKVWDVMYSHKRQPYGVLWPTHWGSPPARGDQVELELDEFYHPVKGRVLGDQTVEVEAAAGEASEGQEVGE